MGSNDLKKNGGNNSLPKNFILSPVLSMAENRSKILDMIERNDDENDIEFEQVGTDTEVKADLEKD